MRFKNKATFDERSRMFGICNILKTAVPKALDNFNLESESNSEMRRVEADEEKNQLNR